MNFRECGECRACCEGALIGNSYGNKFGFGKPCIFMVNKACSIYETRPDTCQSYQCAWTQGLFSEELKPTISNVMISVEVNDNKQYLKVMELSDKIDDSVFEEIDRFCGNNNTHWVRVPYQKIIPIKSV